MKKHIFFILGTLMGATLMAQPAKVLKQTETSARIRFVAPAMQVLTIQANGTTYDQLTLEGFRQSNQIGKPSLPVYSRIIEVPLCAKVSVKTSTPQWRELESQMRHRVIPAQPDRRKSDTSSAIWQQDPKVYSSDTYWGDDALVRVEMIGVARDRNLARITYSPLRYNPVAGKVMVNDSVDVDLIFEEADLAATYRMKQMHHSLGFGIQSDLLLEQPASKDAITNVAPIRYVIVCYSGFRGQMDEFVEWKRQKGFRTDIVYTDDPAVGTSSTSIANYLKGLYTNANVENPAPTYVLLVGDVQQIPAFDSRVAGGYYPGNDHITDLYYATWTNDNVPDCYIGRFSAQTASQLTPQISKTLLYEQYAFADPSYLSNAVLIAGVDQGRSGDNAYTYGDPACDYIAKTYVNSDNGYTSVTYYKNNTSFSPTGVTVTGSSQSYSTSNALRSLYNQGAGWVNYTAHGSAFSWGDPEMNTSHVSQMTNNGKPMMMIGNCCLSSKFDESNCFGESLLRKGNDAGAVAYIGGSNSTYWTHDFYWMVGYRSSCSNTMNTNYNSTHRGMYDNLFHTHDEVFSQWFTTTAAMQYAGNMEVQVSDPSFSRYYWEIYHVLGDPSLEPWLGQASPMPFEGDSVCILGTTTYSFTTAPNAYVAIVDENSNALVAARANGQGTTTLDLSRLTPGLFRMSITAQNHTPRFVNLMIVTPSGPYVMTGNIRPMASVVRAGDTIEFALDVYNLGVDPADVVTLQLTSSNGSMQVLNNNYQLTNLAAGDTVSVTNAFRAVVSNSLLDGAAVPLSITANCGSQSSNTNASFRVSAPLLNVTKVTILPSPTPGATSNVTVDITNAGSLATENAVATLAHHFGMATVGTGSQSLRVIEMGENKQATFTVTFDEFLTEGANIPLQLKCVHSYGQLDTTLTVTIGTGTFDNFESQGFTTLPWQQGNNMWSIVSDAGDPAIFGSYQARSKANLQNSATSELSITHTSIIPDTVSFYVKVSTENNYDWFYFYVDGDERMSLSGDKDWELYSYPVPAGTHTFKFAYTKDYSQSSGSDCAWIDNVRLPRVSKYYEFVTDTICQDSAYVFRGQTLPTDQKGTFVYIDSNYTTYYYLALTVKECHGESISSVENDLHVKVYPNPASSQVNVTAEGIFNVQLVDLQGKVLRQIDNQHDLCQIHIQNLSKGIYFVKVTASNGSTIAKVVVR